MKVYKYMLFIYVFLLNIYLHRRVDISMWDIDVIFTFYRDVIIVISHAHF